MYLGKYALGIIQVQNRFRWVLARQDKTAVIERMEEGETVPQEVLSIKNLTIVTGLEGTEVLRRDVKLPLTTPKSLKAALPFQLEPLLPFPLDQSIVYPQFHPLGKETVVVVWATTQEKVQSHLEKWHLLGIEPDLVASQTLALARWAQTVFPQESECTVVHESTGSTRNGMMEEAAVGVTIDHGRVVCAMESPDPVRLKLFLKQKYPLFHWVEMGSSVEHSFAIPMGLALEPFQKGPCQFRTAAFSSRRQKKLESSLLKRTLAAGVGVIGVTALLCTGILHHQTKKLKHQIAPYYKGEIGSLESGVEHFRDFLIQETKTTPSVYTAPSTQQVLAWLSSLSAPVEISHFEYELKGTDCSEISIEFQARDPRDADLFIKQLRQKPTFVESTHELKWTSHPLGYKLSFPLQKNS